MTAPSPVLSGTLTHSPAPPFKHRPAQANSSSARRSDNLRAAIRFAAKYWRLPHKTRPLASDEAFCEEMTVFNRLAQGLLPVITASAEGLPSADVHKPQLRENAHILAHSAFCACSRGSFLVYLSQPVFSGATQKKGPPHSRESPSFQSS